MTIKFACPHCEQDIEAPSEVIGMVVSCPTCAKEFQCDSKIPPTQHPSNTPKTSHSPLRAVQNIICFFSGLRPLDGFRISCLFSELFKRHSRFETDSYFNCGCPQTTPTIAQVNPAWPRPWFFLRLLAFGFLVLLAFVVGFKGFENPNMIPGLIIVGAFFVPLTCVALFFELNVLRNISLYQVIKFIVFGGAVSLIIALFLFATTGLDQTFLGATSAGIVEEIAKIIAAIVLLRGAQQYKWILNGLLIGAAVGAGFAGFESAGYIFRAFYSDLAAQDTGFTLFYRTLIQRALFAPFCHVVWTAITVGALWRVKRDRPFSFSMFFEKEFLRVLVLVILLHMLWNSGLLWTTPQNIGYIKIQFYLWLTSVMGSWYLAFLLVQEGLLQINASHPIGLTPTPTGCEYHHNDENLSAAIASEECLNDQLGVMYRDGVGVVQNYAEAAKRFRFSAQNGSADLPEPTLRTILKVRFDWGCAFKNYGFIGRGVVEIGNRELHVCGFKLRSRFLLVFWSLIAFVVSGLVSMICTSTVFIAAASFDPAKHGNDPVPVAVNVLGTLLLPFLWFFLCRSILNKKSFASFPNKIDEIFQISDCSSDCKGSKVSIKIAAQGKATKLIVFRTKNHKGAVFFKDTLIESRLACGHQEKAGLGT